MHSIPDNTCNEQGEREHCFSKMRFLRTNKHRQSFVQGIAREETIERCIGIMEAEIHQLEEVTNHSQVESGEPTQNLSTRYSIADSSRKIVSIPHWLTSNDTDPAFTVSSNCFWSMLLTYYIEVSPEPQRPHPAEATPNSRSS